MRNRYSGVRGDGQPRWRALRRSHHTACDEVSWRWLSDGASLTQRLCESCPGPFRVRIRRQLRTRPQPDEAALLGLRRAERALVREVFLYTGGEPRVFARTVIPVRTLHRSGHLSRLGTRPLGAKLFADRSLKREMLQIARIKPEHRLYAAAIEAGGDDPDSLWGRRSVFVLRGRPLLVSELYLPGIDRCTPPPALCRRRPA